MSVYRLRHLTASDALRTALVTRDKYNVCINLYFCRAAECLPRNVERRLVITTYVRNLAK